jgi:stearoyl-CoA desaturase (delta-9 desaturase)
MVTLVKPRKQPKAFPPVPSDPADFDTKGTFRHEIFWTILLLHVGALMVIITSWHEFLQVLQFNNKLSLITWMSFVGPLLGITLCFHRGETHGAFKWTKVGQIFRFIFLCLGHMALQGSLIKWAERHLPHHAFVDRRADSHSPMRFRRVNKRGVELPTVKGFFWAHVGSYFYHHTLPPRPRGDEHPDADHATILAERKEFWVGDLMADPMVRFMRLAFGALTAIRFIIPFLLLPGFQGLRMPGIVSAVFMLNITWCTNSVAHVWGAFLDDIKSEKYTGSSKNVFFVLFFCLFSGGESWHNFHHRLAACAAHGWKWWQIDYVKYLIWGFEKSHLTTNVNWSRKQRANILASVPMAHRPAVPPSEELDPSF